MRDSRAQLEHNKRLVEEGSLAPIDIVAAEAQLAGFEQSLFTALEEVSRTENNLKNLIAVNRQSDIWNLSIVPTDPVALTTPGFHCPTRCSLRWRTGSSCNSQTSRSEINQIDQKYFSDQTKPAVDLVGSYGLVGLSGSINPAGTNPFAGSESAIARTDRFIISTQRTAVAPGPTGAGGLT